ncbi:hypothetical protein A3765_28475 [Oleiphilus sp. HI0130]|nr:hypothetical protein A3765_28810 [Oleiphilus sp. HI0130]KZZ72488.1 hypothetical protein A3765_28475 [Oleiphilus sp. HI0130]
MQGLVLVKTPDQVTRDERAVVTQKAEAERIQREQLTSSLAAHVRRAWEVAKRHKEPIEKQMIENVRQLAGVYSDAKLAELQDQGLPAIYMQLTSVKSRAAKSWIRDVLMPAGDNPWMLQATEQPSIPNDVKARIMQKVQADAMQFMQSTGQKISPQQMMEAAKKLEEFVTTSIKDEADTRIAKMASKIKDQLQEGKWKKSFNDVLSDVVDFPAGIIKGPVARYKKRMKWTKHGVQVANEVVYEVERVNPFHFYPAPGAVEPDDGDCIEVHEYTPAQIEALKGLPGYDSSAIDLVLQEHSLQGLSNWSRDSLRSELYKARGHKSGSNNEEKTIESLEFWGSVKGSMLISWGMRDQNLKPNGFYDVMCELIGRHVICVRINPNPLGGKPYGKACFEDIPGSFWGRGVPDLIRDCQNVCNAAARALVANMGISSGPQVAVNQESLMPGTSIEQIYPWRIWQLDFNKVGQSSRPPIEFFQPNSNTKELMAVFKEFSSLADEYSGIPAYSYGVGQSVGGAGKTAAGLSMLMNAASKAIKNVVEHIDSGIIEPTISRYYIFNMLFDQDDSIKGDAQIIARGAMSLVAKEQNQMRLQEMLNQTANPVDMEIIGLDGRAELLRRAFQGVDVSADTLPTKEEIQARMSAQANQPPAPQPVQQV